MTDTATPGAFVCSEEQPRHTQLSPCQRCSCGPCKVPRREQGGWGCQWGSGRWFWAGEGSFSQEGVFGATTME